MNSLLHFEFNNFGTGKFFDINCNVDLVHVPFFFAIKMLRLMIFTTHVNIFYRAKNKWLEQNVPTLYLLSPDYLRLASASSMES